jgi:alkanesulfonate monooxygenase SsuD/methylene tetrahydromethanopterin reductase-like flavin-dependent oxidoreductase (luciferase family)
MENEKSFYQQCALILGRELEVLKQIGVLQNIIWQAISSREWTDFEAHNQAVNALGFEFEALETKRLGLLSEMGAAGGREDEKRRFYALISCFSPELRDELADLYRSLKLETMKIRMANETLIDFLAGAKTMITGFLEAAFPDRAGRLYTPQGTQAAADLRSVVLNRHF